MPKTRMNCPNCRQPIVADVNSLFDVGQDPRMKQMVLSGMINIAQCQQCGYQGNLATPIVYHDPEKELLLTYFPPELALPVKEQERIVGPLIKQVMDGLPPEKRKGYLLQPKSMLTLQGLVETILGADGITKEMIEASQKKLNLLQQLLQVSSEDALNQLIKENDSLMDGEFFTLLGRLATAALAQRDENAARSLNGLQAKLLPMTTFGREYQAQSKEVEATMQALQGLGENPTREQVLDLLLRSPSETSINVIASLARPALDYAFFQLLTGRIDSAAEDERQKLVELRTYLQEVTHRIDQEIDARKGQALKQLNEVLKSKNIEEVISQNIEAIDDFFISVLDEQIEQARRSGDLERSAKLRQVSEAVQKASQPPAEIGLIEELVNLPDDEAMQKELEAHKDSVTPEFVELLGSVTAQMEQNGDAETTARLHKLYRMAVRLSMKKQMGN